LIKTFCEINPQTLNQIAADSIDIVKREKVVGYELAVPETRIPNTESRIPKSED